MSFLSEHLFPHRMNSDGSYDSICTKCYATVSSSEHEEDLTAQEELHVCDPVRVHLLRTVNALPAGIS